jgi:hypothetical protein
MEYSLALQAINPINALSKLSLEGKQEGGYIYFPCPECQGRAVVKAWGSKRTLSSAQSAKPAGILSHWLKRSRGLSERQLRRTLIT